MKKILCLLFVLLLTGCSSILQSDTKPIDRLPLNPKLPAPLVLTPVKFNVINRDNAGAVFDLLEKQGLQPVLFGLSGSDYKSLSINIDKIKNFLILQREIIKAYKEYYEPEKAPAK